MITHYGEPVSQQTTTARGVPNTTHPRRQEVVAPLGTATTGHLSIASGVNGLALSGDGTLPDLLQARFEGQIPDTSCRDGVVTIRYPRFSLTSWMSGLLEPTSTATIVLNGSIPWCIEIDGGVAALAADLTGVRLDRLRVGGGVSRAALLLPRPSGAVPVRFGGGVSELLILRPLTVPARLRVRGGASGLSFDQQQAGAVSGEIHWQSVEFDGAHDYYEIEVAGGARDLTIDAV